MSQKPERYSSQYDFPDNGILLLDSGVGSLSIGAEIKKLLPSVPILSIGDQKFFPYGIKSEDFILERVHELLSLAFKKFSPSVVVVACNTASTCVLDSLRRSFPIPIVGVVPPVKPAAVYSKNRQIGILCTDATSKREYLDDLIQDFASDCSVVKVGCNRLAELAEKRISGCNVLLEDIKSDLKRYMHELKKVDSLVLGCTHFSVFRDELQTIIGSQVLVFDPAVAVAKQVSRVFNGSSFESKSLYWYMTTAESAYISKEKCLSFSIDQVYSI